MVKILEIQMKSLMDSLADRQSIALMVRSKEKIALTGFTQSMELRQISGVMAAHNYSSGLQNISFQVKQ